MNNVPGGGKRSICVDHPQPLVEVLSPPTAINKLVIKRTA